jgi:hypothetical protein
VRGNGGNVSDLGDDRRRKSPPLRDLDRLDTETPSAIFASTPEWRPNGPVLRRTPHRRGRSLPRRLLRVVLVTGLVVVVARFGLSSVAEALPMRWQVALGNETAQPGRPTVFSDGSYTFLGRQPFNPNEPMGYNPCKRILLLVNLRGAPPDAMDLVFTAMADIHRASGLTFRYVGQSPDRPDYGRGRVGPVLVSWSDQTEMPQMDAGVLGVGGSGSYQGQRGETTYLVSGLVTLSAQSFATMGRGRQQAVIDHEFGHLVGLGHVDDTGEIMNPYVTDRTTFGHGDLTGLALLGRLPCR